MKSQNVDHEIECGRERINEIMNLFHYEPKAFARMIGMSPGALNNILFLKKGYNINTLRAICAAFPVEYKWLNSGEGNRLTCNDNDIAEYFSENYTNSHRNVDKDVNKRVLTVRKLVGASQAIFAAELSIKRDIETFRTSPSVVLIKRISALFNVNLTWLMLGTGEMVNKKVSTWPG